MTRRKALVAALLGGLAAAVAGAAEPDYRVLPGDTLWDLAGRFRGDPTRWPELWSLNPHLRNPHRLTPGDGLSLHGPSEEGRQVRLPLERLGAEGDTGGEGGPAAGGAVPGATAEQGSGAPAGPEEFSFARNRVLDFVSSHRLPRLGAVANPQPGKVVYGEGEEVALALEPGANLGAGDVLTVFDDRAAVAHPVSGAPYGYYVRVLGEVELRSVEGRRGRGVLLRTVDAVEDGYGLAPRREPRAALTAQPARVGVEGVILTGRPGQALLATEDLVVVDRGRLHGVEVGVVLVVPPGRGERAVQGVADLTSPLARLVVVDVQDKTATGVVVDSRAAVGAGDRVVTQAVSP